MVLVAAGLVGVLLAFPQEPQKRAAVLGLAVALRVQDEFAVRFEVEGGFFAGEIFAGNGVEGELLKQVAHLLAFFFVALDFDDVVRVGDDLEGAGDAALAAGAAFVAFALVLVDDHVQMDVQIHGQSGKGGDGLGLLRVVVLQNPEAHEIVDDELGNAEAAAGPADVVDELFPVADADVVVEPEILREPAEGLPGGVLGVGAIVGEGGFFTVAFIDDFFIVDQTALGLAREFF